MARFDMTPDVPQEGNGSSYLEPGIYENIVLSDVVYKETDNGNKFIAFYFKDENGNTVPKTEWEPREGDNIETKVNNQLARIKHIAVNSGIMSKDEFVFKAENFEQLAKQVEEKLRAKKDKWDSHKLRIKVVYDFNNYTTLPSYTKFAWLESMDVPKDQSKVKILPIDKMERDVPDEEPQSNGNPFKDSQEQGESDNNETPQTETANVPF